MPIQSLVHWWQISMCRKAKWRTYSVSECLPAVLFTFPLLWSQDFVLSFALFSQLVWKAYIDFKWKDRFARQIETTNMRADLVNSQRKPQQSMPTRSPQWKGSTGKRKSELPFSMTLLWPTLGKYLREVNALMLMFSKLRLLTSSSQLEGAVDKFCKVSLELKASCIMTWSRGIPIEDTACTWIAMMNWQ